MSGCFTWRAKRVSEKSMGCSLFFERDSYICSIAFVLFQEQKKKSLSAPPKCCRESSLAGMSRASFYTSSLMHVFLCVLDSEADGNSLYTSNSQLAYGDVNRRANPSHVFQSLAGKLNVLSFLRFPFFFLSPLFFSFCFFSSPWLF